MSRIKLTKFTNPNDDEIPESGVIIGVSSSNGNTNLYVKDEYGKVYDIGTTQSSIPSAPSFTSFETESITADKVTFKWEYINKSNLTIVSELHYGTIDMKEDDLTITPAIALHNNRFTLDDLTPSTDYKCFMVMCTNDIIVSSPIIKFTTEKLPSPIVNTVIDTTQTTADISVKILNSLYKIKDVQLCLDDGLFIMNLNDYNAALLMKNLTSGVTYNYHLKVIDIKNNIFDIDYSNFITKKVEKIEITIDAFNSMKNGDSSMTTFRRNIINTTNTKILMNGVMYTINDNNINNDNVMGDTTLDIVKQNIYGTDYITYTAFALTTGGTITTTASCTLSVPVNYIITNKYNNHLGTVSIYLQNCKYSITNRIKSFNIMFDTIGNNNWELSYPITFDTNMNCDFVIDNNKYNEIHTKYGNVLVKYMASLVMKYNNTDMILTFNSHGNLFVPSDMENNLISTNEDSYASQIGTTLTSENISNINNHTDTISNILSDNDSKYLSIELHIKTFEDFYNKDLYDGLITFGVSVYNTDVGEKLLDINNKNTDDIYKMVEIISPDDKKTSLTRIPSANIYYINCVLPPFDILETHKILLGKSYNIKFYIDNKDCRYESELFKFYCPK